MAASDLPEVRPSPGDAQLDALTFALGQPAAIPGERADAAWALEVYQVFGESVLASRLYAPGEAVRIGNPAGDDPRVLAAPLDGLPPEAELTGTVAAFVPDAAAPSGWAVRLAPGWGGEVVRGGARLALRALGNAPMHALDADGLARIPLAAGDQAILTLGAVTLVARPVRPGKAVPRPDPLRADPGRMGLFGFVVVALTLFAVAIGTIPPAPAASRNLLDDGRYDLLLLRPPPPPPPTASNSPKQEPAGGGGEGASTRRPGGRRADHDGGPAGLLDALERGSLADILGDSSLSANVTQGIAGLIGARATGPALGLAGRSGLDGGGFEGFDGGGRPGGPRGPGGDPWGGGRTIGKPDGGRVTTPDDGVTLGGIRPDEVDRVVKRHLAQIRYCYQRELQKNPALAGKLSVKFTIAADGSVSSATASSSTLEAPAVEACVASRFLRMQFPSVRGGGVALVKYPFVFAPG